MRWAFHVFGYADAWEFETGVGLPRFVAADAGRGGKWSGPRTFWGRGRRGKQKGRRASQALRKQRPEGGRGMGWVAV